MTAVAAVFHMRSFMLLKLMLASMLIGTAHLHVTAAMHLPRDL